MGKPRQDRRPRIVFCSDPKSTQVDFEDREEPDYEDLTGGHSENDDGINDLYDL